jgi:hypothetical protein
LRRGAVQVNVADPVGGGGLAAITVMANGPIDDVLVPSVAVMVILGLAPTLLAAGVPRKAPVFESKFAHAGFCAMVKAADALLGVSVGWNE